MFRSLYDKVQRQINLKEEDRIALLEQWKKSGAKPEITSWWNQTFYVDQQNGSDDNDGSQNAPFFSIQKAIDSAPVGGFCKIHIIGDYDFKTNCYICRKSVQFVLYGTLKIHFYSSGTIARQASLRLTDASCIFFIDSYNNGKLVLLPNSTGKPVINDTGFIKQESWSTSYLFTRFQILTHTSNYHPIIINEGNLVSVEPLANYGFYASVSITGHYGQSNTQIQVNSGSYLVNFAGRCGTFYFNYSGGVSDLSGNPVNIADKIAGVIKDSNGNPRNVISNIVL